MATGTNAIATRQEAATKLNYITASLSVTNPNKCCTVTEAINFGAHSSYLPANGNRLVRYLDLYQRYTYSITETDPYGICAMFNAYDYGGMYIIVTISIYGAGLTFSKETRIEVNNSYKLNGMPSGYIGITSHPAIIPTLSSTGAYNILVFPTCSFSVPYGKEFEVANTTINISLYLSGADDSSLMSSDYGSGGGVLIKSIDAYVGGDLWVSQYHGTASAGAFYKDSTPFYDNGNNVLYGNWIPGFVGGREMIACYDSSTTKTKTESTVFV